MNLLCRLEILLVCWWIQVAFVPGTHGNNGVVSHLSEEVVLLFKDEQSPKCFTRTGKDFTCFFESEDNRTYDLLYTVKEERRCEMSIQRTERGTFLHICTFPDPDVKLYVDISLEVVERVTNTSLYTRTVSVEDHMLLDPPYNVSLHQNGEVGQLQVAWHAETQKYMEPMYRIRYSSTGLGEKIKEVEKGVTLDSLVQGEEVEVQVSVKCAFHPDRGHWSSWSDPVRAAVPQRAGDISLICYTSDLHNITCHWNGSRYGAEKKYRLFYKTGFSEPVVWTQWTECLADENFTDLCCFHGDKSRKVRVKLSMSPISRTFYTEEFTLSNSIKTSPPDHLRGALKRDKLCLKWEAPLPSLMAHLQYEVDYQIQGGEGWKMRKGPETNACVDVPTGSQYSVKVRAKPTGPMYSGNWSDWSEVVIGNTPTDTGMLLMLSIPVSMLIAVIVLIFLFSTYLRKIKLYFWPPVPNLDKVLQGFLTEINKQKWDPPVTAKQCSEETTSSVVEIMSKDKVSGLGRALEESTERLSSEESSPSREQLDGSTGTEIFPDYVTLNKDSVFLCPQGNSYVCEQVREKGDPVAGDELHRPCTDTSVCVPSGVGTDFLNNSYLPLAECADKFTCKVTAERGPGNLYTNFPFS